MPNFADLIPELASWNRGTSMAPDDWIFAVGRADHALGLCAALWPELVHFEGYVLRGPLDVQRLRAWEKAGHSRLQVEAAMNAYLIEDIFPDDPADAQLKARQSEALLAIMTDMLSAKLARDFPQYHFSVFVIDGENLGVSFHRTQ
jgi:hypothetical protein